MIDVGGNDGPTTGNFIAHELWCNLLRNGRPKRLAWVLTGQQINHFGANFSTCVLQAFNVFLAAQVLANGHILHFRRNNTLASVMHLRHVFTGLRLARFALQVETQFCQLGVIQALNAVFRTGATQQLCVIAFFNPGIANGRQA